MMENEERAVQSHDAEQNDASVDIAEQPKPRRSSRKTLLIAAIVSVITIGALVMLRGQVDALHSIAATPEHAMPALHVSATNPRSVDSVEPPTSGTPETIKRTIEGLSDRINQWFESVMTEQSSTNRELSGLAAGMSAIHESIAELRKGNDELKQRITDAYSQLQAIAEDVRGLKIASKKKAAVQQKQVSSVPPFLIDAIDLWDDAVYVAVSQNGQVAFLREGEQRSGWQVTHIDRLNKQVALRGPEGQDYSTSIRR
ncbi:hypothetical protein [Aquamicrobium sp.]|uniref:hypothetical protein n=1 Tax=Aquamicrobium sp. TaxID=1872579 RepID=UPI002588E2BE|nr:hypothetical protein [Aquamicrobium sp.]MCK9550610.1 hypothetical protein [Aquamicrobium sp.]